MADENRWRSRIAWWTFGGAVLTFVGVLVGLSEAFRLDRSACAGRSDTAVCGTHPYAFIGFALVLLSLMFFTLVLIAGHLANGLEDAAIEVRRLRERDDEDRRQKRAR